MGRHSFLMLEELSTLGRWSRACLSRSARWWTTVRVPFILDPVTIVTPLFLLRGGAFAGRNRLADIIVEELRGDRTKKTSVQTTNRWTVYMLWMWMGDKHAGRECTDDKLTDEKHADDKHAYVLDDERANDERANDERANDKRANDECANNERANNERANDERVDDEYLDNECVDDEGADDECMDDERMDDEHADDEGASDV
ncbi:hypothetical protein FISHEDRAFT_61835 [Fistulina hepatica ATCC 64428]|uniref:Uncharacterized protein n=1 Tax=Fistulina hepatica ATCC 64428 TaxID=1128425 RepID=A0A0D7A0I6_9AGAR|nr:hypothetical protein FISHEDRAFT_61835 [Fistulina hepatica ATCC 64428]